MMEPRYRGVLAIDIPEVTDEDGVGIKIIAGAAAGVTGPVRDVVTAPEYLDVMVPAGKTFGHHTPRGHTVFAYVIGGEGSFDDKRRVQIGDGHLVLFGDGDTVSIAAGAEPVRFLLISGKPIGEPIAWGGPIVMNTAQELEVAFEELKRGTFIKERP